MTTTAETRTARKRYTCGDWGLQGQRHSIEPGEEYARHVAFPGDDANPDGPGPLVLLLCCSCQTMYGRQMPPRRPKAAAHG